MCRLECGAYQDSIRRTVFWAPGFNDSGTKSEAPGAPLSTAAVSRVLPSFTVFHAIVKGSHHPPRNQQWSTIVAGSSVKMAKESSFSCSTKPLGMPEMRLSVLSPEIRKFFALKEKVASRVPLE